MIIVNNNYIIDEEESTGEFFFASHPKYNIVKGSIDFSFWFRNSNLTLYIVHKLYNLSFDFEDYCFKNQCSVPIYSSGEHNFSISKDSKTIISYIIHIPNSILNVNMFNPSLSMKNIGIYKSHIFSQGKYDIMFKKRSVSSGTHSYPFSNPNYVIDRFVSVSVPYIQSINMITIPSHIFGFDNLEMDSWNIIYNSLMPVFISGFSNQTYDSNRMIIVHNENCMYHPHIALLSQYRVLCLDRPIVFSNLTIGFDKSLKVENGQAVHYSFDSKIIIAFKNYIMKRINHNVEYDPKRIIYFFNSSSSVLVNQEEVMKSINRFANRFNIEYINVANTSVIQQLRSASNAWMMIGFLPETLANVIWMKPESYVLEIKPYGFKCMDWIESVAKASGLVYTSLYGSPSQNKSKMYQNNVLQKCVSGEFDCNTAICFKVLSKQYVFVNTSLLIDNLEKAILNRNTIQMI